ncbi:GntR family transcriptional regulator [Streptomyces sp. NPDC056323]|uniref:GntR family transcriptional regulator n=1 Tax=Streptomyces sp. NPDC056323 TaxID=3345784 RepID=UPI0035DD489C
MPRKTGEQPKYKDIADDLRRRIDDGEFAEKGKLPAERALLKEYADKVKSAVTIRQALSLLRDEGIVESRLGSGWYVLEWRPIVRNGLKRLSSEQWGEGKSIWDVDVDGRLTIPDGVEIETLPAEVDVATALGVDAGALVCRRDRRYLVDEVPVLRSTAYIPEDLARGTRITQVDTGPGGTYKQLEEAGHKPVRFREDLRCRKALPAEAEDLELATSAPVVELVRYAYDAADRVVEVNRMILDASRYLFRYDFSS